MVRKPIIDSEHQTQIKYTSRAEFVKQFVLNRSALGPGSKVILEKEIDKAYALWDIIVAREDERNREDLGDLGANLLDR